MHADTNFAMARKHFEMYVRGLFFGRLRKNAPQIALALDLAPRTLCRGARQLLVSSQDCFAVRLDDAMQIQFGTKCAIQRGLDLLATNDCPWRQPQDRFERPRSIADQQPELPDCRPDLKSGARRQNSAKG